MITDFYKIADKVQTKTKQQNPQIFANQILKDFIGARSGNVKYEITQNKMKS